MNDEVLTIRLTEAEINMIMDALHIVAQTGGDTRGHDIAELRDLEHDLMEQVARHDDPDWTIDTEPTEIAEGTAFTVTEDDFIDHGIRAREMAKNQKATSRAAERREELLARGTASPVFNDPIDW
tara:strand:- start:1974 stop:2348 length:375 start_codon:yes stop_codon:yes gene_type:complete